MLLPLFLAVIVGPIIGEAIGQYVGSSPTVFVGKLIYDLFTVDP